MSSPGPYAQMVISSGSVGIRALISRSNAGRASVSVSLGCRITRAVYRLHPPYDMSLTSATTAGGTVVVVGGAVVVVVVVVVGGVIVVVVVVVGGVVVVVALLGCSG